MNGLQQEGLVLSPCTRVCVLDAHQVCTGCGRTSAEIAIWPYADSNLRREIRRSAQLRRQQPAPPAQP